MTERQTEFKHLQLFTAEPKDENDQFSIFHILTHWI